MLRSPFCLCHLGIKARRKTQGKSTDMRTTCIRSHLVLCGTNTCKLYACNCTCSAALRCGNAAADARHPQFGSRSRRLQGCFEAGAWHSCPDAAVGTLGHDGTQRASNGSARYGRAWLDRICPAQAVVPRSTWGSSAASLTLMGRFVTPSHTRSSTPEEHVRTGQWA